MLFRSAATSKGRKAAFERGDIVAWAKGLTKETDARVAAGASLLKEKYEDGTLTPWAKGLKKEEDVRIERMSARVSMSLRQKSIRDRLDEMKRLPHDEIRRRIEESGDLEVVEGLQHYVNDASRVIVVRCKKCGDSFQGSLRMLGKGRCFNCSPGGSMAQEQVAKYVETLGVEVKRNDRKEMSMELDIYVPRKRVAVEYNGLYWHCHVHKSSHYHSNKSKLAKETGISLIHVFEDEWRDKRSIVESIIRAKLGLCEERVGARECEVVQLTSSERQSFFEANHLDGDVRSEMAWGLKAGDRIVYGLSLRRDWKSTRLNSSHVSESRMPSSA